MSRRELRWQSIDEAVVDARLLHEHGYDRLNKWNLVQNVGHLTLALIGSMEGQIDGNKFSAPKVVQWIVLALGEKKRVYAKRRLRNGLPAPKFIIPAPQSDRDAEAAAIAEYADAVRRYRSFTGDLAPHPAFGRVTREEWDEFHVIHAMHHLSWLVPKS